MTEQFYGLITALLAFSNIIQPILSFGVQHTIIKFYSNCKDKIEQNSLLIYSIVFPFILILFFSIFFNLKYDLISNYLSSKNSLIKKYIFFIILISISTSYFEVFYSWLKIKRKTIFGNFMKEVYPRLLTFTLLILYFFLLIDIDEFIIYFIVGYYLRLLIIIIKASFIHSLSLSKISFSRDWFVYSGYIFLSAFAASILIDIDKSMISQFLTIENVAYYSIGAFIAALVDIPSTHRKILDSSMLHTSGINNDVRTWFVVKSTMDFVFSPDLDLWIVATISISPSNSEPHDSAFTGKSQTWNEPSLDSVPCSSCTAV